MKKTVFEGSGVAIITPFTEDGVEYPKLGELIDFQIQQGTDCRDDRRGVDNAGSGTYPDDPVYGGACGGTGSRFGRRRL